MDGALQHVARAALLELKTGLGEGAKVSATNVTVQIEREGRVPDVHNDLADGEIIRLFRDLEGETDTTFIMSLGGTDESVMIAVSGSKAFIGLEGLDGLYQYSGSVDHSGEVRLTIRGVETPIDSRYVVDVATAATVVQGFLRGDQEPGSGTWERQ
jgi:hypothetical protein